MMIYDLLNSYSDYLLNDYSKDTARTYYKRLCTLFEGQSLTNTVNNLDIEKILNKLSRIKHKNVFSQAKNALLHFCEFQNITLSVSTLERISELEKGTRKKYRKQNIVDFKQIENRIKHIKNKKLKLCYEVILATGLRVSELSSITHDDCIINDDFIILNFIGKGRAKDSVTIKTLEYPIVYQRVKTEIKNIVPNKKLFYSAIYLQIKAKELGFKCHDLRRVFAKLEYKKTHSKIAVKEKLRHSSLKTTNIYIRSRIKV